MTTAVFEHAMLREIYEQPRALADTIEHYAPTASWLRKCFSRWPKHCAAAHGW